MQHKVVWMQSSTRCMPFTKWAPFINFKRLKFSTKFLTNSCLMTILESHGKVFDVHKHESMTMGWWETSVELKKADKTILIEIYLHLVACYAWYHVNIRLICKIRHMLTKPDLSDLQKNPVRERRMKARTLHFVRKDKKLTKERKPIETMDTHTIMVW